MPRTKILDSTIAQWAWCSPAPREDDAGVLSSALSSDGFKDIEVLHPLAFGNLMLSEVNPWGYLRSAVRSASPDTRIWISINDETGMGLRPLSRYALLTLAECLVEEGVSGLRVSISRGDKSLLRDLSEDVNIPVEPILRTRPHPPLPLKGATTVWVTGLPAVPPRGPLGVITRCVFPEELPSKRVNAVERVLPPLSPITGYAPHPGDRIPRSGRVLKSLRLSQRASLKDLFDEGTRENPYFPGVIHDGQREGDMPALQGRLYSAGFDERIRLTALMYPDKIERLLVLSGGISGGSFVSGGPPDAASTLTGSEGHPQVSDVGGWICSPMPGRVVEVAVRPGDAVRKGDPLLVIEGMKMQNTLASPWSASVKEVLVKVGDRVAADENLILLGRST